MKRLSFFTILVLSFQSLADFRVVEKSVGAIKISFVRNNVAELDAKGEEKYYDKKASFAVVERLAPLNRSALVSLSANDVKTLSLEDFNQLYARLKSGPHMLGDYKGTVLQKSALFQAMKKKILQPLKSASALSSVVATVCGTATEDCVVDLVWKGKRFSAKNNFGQIEALTLLQLPLVTATLFPMNTYCGLSHVDSRRESIITDGGFADDFPSYIPLRDEVITRKNLYLTEEFRMVRPGLYIGKVYSNKAFLFNVALEKTSGPSTESADACFDGTKTR